MITYAKTTNGLYRVKVIGQSAHDVIACPQFQNWLDNFDHEHLFLETVAIQSADIFAEGKVIFVKMETEVTNRKSGKPVPGIVFLRGNAISIFTLVVNSETGERHILVTKQARVPLGSCNFVEIPAGMDDKKDGPVGRALAEMEEETSIKLTREMLEFIGDWFPSAGGCDEMISSFWTKVELSGDEVEKIVGKLHGCADENEEIQLEIFTIDEFVQKLTANEFKDGKMLASIALKIIKDDPQAVVRLLQNC